MIHYHVTPIGGKKITYQNFMQNRHFMVSFVHNGDLPEVAAYSNSFVFDNGAYSVWKSGKTLDIPKYIKWCDRWHKHPGFDWCIIPDVIMGSEEENDAMLDRWDDEAGHINGVPVWHYDESVERLERLCNEYNRVAIGSTDGMSPNTASWWERTKVAFDAICDDDGRPPCKLHGLRMMNPKIVTKLPLSSCDASTVALNAFRKRSFGKYLSPSTGIRCMSIASHLEQFNSPAVWKHGIKGIFDNE